jgi:hypothetical protein
MRRALTPLALATLLLLMSAQLALAAAPFHDKFVLDDTFEENLCGIDVTTHLQVRGNVISFEDHLLDVSHVLVTWTNADGAWLQNFGAGPVTVSEQLDGDILTITEGHAGVHERLRSSEGLTPAFDRGQIVFSFVIDLNDLENPDDDVFLSLEVVFVAGPHPEVDSDFALFCEVVTDTLG